MEKIIRFFVERHLLVNVLTAAVVVLGLLALMRTNVAGFPEATLPMYLVSASLPGAAAKDVETKISIPIEDELRERCCQIVVRAWAVHSESMPRLRNRLRIAGPLTPTVTS